MSKPKKIDKNTWHYREQAAKLPAENAPVSLELTRAEFDILLRAVVQEQVGLTDLQRHRAATGWIDAKEKDRILCRAGTVDALVSKLFEAR
jgi:hypothetical protein